MIITQQHRTLVADPSTPQQEINVTNLYTAFSYYYAPTYKFHGERHPAWEVFFVNLGEVTIQTDTETYILGKGQFLVIKPNDFHQIHANNVSCSVYVFSFDCECDKMNLITDQIHTATSYQTHLITNIVNEGMTFLAGKNSVPNLNEGEIPGFACGQLSKILLEAFLIQIIRSQLGNYVIEQKSESVHNESTIVKLTINFMTENVCKKLKLEEIAKSVGYSVSHLYTIFKKNIGASIMQYFIDLRIKKAKELICENKMTLTQISEYMDFDSLQYFSVQFKKNMGITPSQYSALIKTQKYARAYEYD